MSLGGIGTALLKVSRRIPEYVSAMPDAFKARGASDLVDGISKKSMELIEAGRQNYSDPAAYISQRYTTADLEKRAPILGTELPGKMVGYLSPYERILDSRHIKSGIKLTKTMFEPSTLRAKHILGIATPSVAEREKNMILRASQVESGNIYLSNWNAYNQRVRGQEVKPTSSTIRAGMFNLENRLLSFTNEADRPLTQSEFLNGIHEAWSKRIDPKDVEIPEAGAVLKHVLDWNAKRRNLIESTGKMTPVEKVPDDEILYQLAERGTKISSLSDEAKADLIGNWRKEEDVNRKWHLPRQYDQAKIHDNQGKISESMYSRKLEIDNIRQNDTDTRHVRKLDTEIEKRKYRIQKMSEELEERKKALAGTEEGKAMKNLGMNKRSLKKTDAAIKDVEKRIKEIEGQIAKDGEKPGLKKRLVQAQERLKKGQEKAATLTAEIEKGRAGRSQEGRTYGKKKAQRARAKQALKRWEKKREEVFKAIQEETADQFDERKMRYERGMKAAVQKTLNRILGSPSGYLDFPDKVTKDSAVKTSANQKKPGGTRSRFLKRRLLGPEFDDILTPYTNRDPVEIMNLYDRATIPGVVMKEWGFDFARAVQLIDEEKAMKIAENPALEKEIADEAQMNIDVIEAMTNRVLGHQIDTGDPRKFGARATSFLIKLANVILMQNVPLASVSDVGRISMELGFKPVGKTLSALSKDFPGAMEKITAQMKYNMEKIGIAGDMITAARYHETTDMIGGSGGNWLERGMNWLSEKTAQVSFTNGWNDYAKRWTGIMVGDSFLDKGLKLLAGDTIPDTELAMEALVGLERKDLMAMAQHWQEFARDEAGPLKLSNTGAWKDLALKHKFESAMAGYVDRIIAVPFAGSRPLTMDTSWGRILFLYKTFSIISTQGILVAGLQRADALRMQGVLAMMFFGWAGYMARSVALGRDISDDSQQHLLEAIDRSGVLGVMMDANNIIERMTAGQVGLSPMLGGEGMSRFKAQDIMGLIAGPSVGVISTAGRATGATFKQLFGEPSSMGDVNAQFRMVPFSNMAHFNWGTRMIKDGYANMLGVPMEEE